MINVYTSLMIEHIKQAKNYGRFNILRNSHFYRDSQRHK